jgi:hypothetical protein
MDGKGPLGPRAGIDAQRPAPVWLWHGVGETKLETRPNLEAHWRAARQTLRQTTLRAYPSRDFEVLAQSFANYRRGRLVIAGGSLRECLA